MVSRGADYAVIETTSHGLAQRRVAGCEYDVAVVTNITHEHLDYHGTYAAYREAKAMLFRGLGAGTHKPGVPKVAVLNADDSSYAYLNAIPAGRRITYGLAERAQVTARDVAVSPAGLHFTVCTPEFEIALDSPLVGRFNVANILAAVGVAWSQGVPPEAIRAAVAGVGGVRGRMERIDRGQPFTVIVDFAHTPNALDNALQTARDLAEGHRVLVVFGCAGLRDRAKRPMMGEVAGRLADHTIITAEDPRTESLAEISEEIAAGCRQAGQAEGQGYQKVPDRGEAIRAALAMARPGDVVIVTGKGHEESMCFGTTEYPWSDHQAVADGLRELGYG
jgi:UDP-N-acetylmuramoyl-L-alanyl-D-glutamate--2,6-diaminopimelate ligase